MEKIISEIKWIIYKNGSFHIVDLGKGIKAKGDIVVEDESIDLRGITFEFEGVWQNSKHGQVFSFSSAKMVTDELFFFLTKVVKGVGKDLGVQIIEKFGDNLENILENSPEKLQTLPGIGKKRCEQIAVSWKKNSRFRKISSLLSGYGINTDRIKEIYNDFGDSSVEEIKNNPYLISNYSNLPFSKIDSIALKLGIELNSEIRIKACFDYILEKYAQESGNTAIERNILIKNCLKLGGFENTDENFYSLDSILENNSKYVKNQNFISLEKYAYFEENIFKFAQKKTAESGLNLSENSIEEYIEDFENSNCIKLSKNQKNAVKEAVNSKFFLISGYAGTGKTTVTKAILQIFAMYCHNGIIGTAVSGIAARRLADVTGFEARTIHSLLGFNGLGFVYNSDNKLPYDVILLDEAGMVNSELFFNLISACDDNCIFIAVGDDAQLPPIGPGNVFSDLMKSEIFAHVKLDEIWRQHKDSVINIYAGNIRKGIIPENYEKTHLDWYFAFIEENEYGFNEELLSRILNISKKYAETDDLLNSIQILSPMKKGLVGCENLNIELKKVFNSNFTDNTSIERAGRVFNSGDKVIHLKNKDKNVWDYRTWKKTGENEDFCETERVFNGTLGLIEKISPKNQKFYVRTNTDYIVEYDFSEIPEYVDHAFAVTVHKSQGSEFDVVIIPVTPSHSYMLDNQLLYTGVTRAKKGIILAGSKSSFEYGVKNQSKKERHTVLKIKNHL